MREEIALRLLQLLGVLFAVAGGGILLSWALRGKQAGHEGMGTRFAVEVFTLAGVFVPAYLGGPWLLFAAVAMGCLCAGELYGTFESGGDRPFKLVGMLVGLWTLFYTYLDPGWVGTFFPILLAAYWALRLATGSDATSIAGRIKRTLFGILYPFVCLAFYIDIGMRPEVGFGYVVLYYGLAEINDSAAYLVGSTIGKHKIFPKLSPKKTVEGVVGGLVLTIALAFGLWFAVPHFGWPRLVGAAVVMAVAGLAGDLFASRLKRRVGVKDYGELIPTQGGVLDVYDAFLFVAPVFYYYLMLTGGA